MQRLTEAREVRARKAHRCESCGEVISQGTTYVVEKWSRRRTAFQLRWHVECRRRWEALARAWPGSRHIPIWFGDFPVCTLCQGYGTTPAGAPCPRCSTEAPDESEDDGDREDRP